MFFMEQGALDYIMRLEGQATPEAAAGVDTEAAAIGCDVTSKKLEHVAPSGEHGHTHLNLLDAVQAAHKHTHLCGTSGGKGGSTLALRTPAQQMALCVSLELSIVVHSVIIGCACSASVAVPNILLTLHFPCSLACSFELGLNPDNSTLVGLVVVLCFHQFFEGLGLGSYIGHMAG